MRRQLNLLLRLLIPTVLCGCETITGPMISPVEYRIADEALQAKALRFRYAQTIRVQAVGMRLVEALPPEVRGAAAPYTGLLLTRLDRRSAAALGIPWVGPSGWGRSSIAVAGVVPGSPADRAGVHAGDLVLQVGGYPIRDEEDVVLAFHRLVPGSSAQTLIERQGAQQWVTLAIGAKSFPVSFQVVTDGEEAGVWNAYASPGEITVTARLLEFMHSDDELAVVMGHELAHLTRGHLTKGLGTSLLGSLLSNTVTRITGVDILGDVSGTVVYTAFSREFEREADYVGLQYVYRAGYDITVAPRLWERVATELPHGASIPWLSSHPSDPERMVRLQKEVEELTRQGSAAAPAPRQ